MWSEKPVPTVYILVYHSWHDKLIKMNRLNITRGLWGGDEGEVGYKRTTWQMLVTGMFCNSDNIPVPMLYYNLGGCHHWGKLSKGYTGSLCIISYVHVNIWWSQNKKLKKLVFASHLTEQFHFSQLVRTWKGTGSTAGLKMGEYGDQTYHKSHKPPSI